MMEVEITLLSGVNSIVIRGKGKAFLTTKDAMIIDRDMLTQIIVIMLQKGYIDHRVIEGVLEDIHTL
jgi:TPP-dependent 2-oxoacid decarboxylase